MKKVLIVLTAVLLLALNACTTTAPNRKSAYETTLLEMEELSRKSDESRPAIVYLPGVMGTKMYSEGKGELWPPKLTNFRKTMPLMYLDAEGNSIQSDIKAGLPFDDVYGELYAYLEKQGYNVYYFGYDWRLNNAESAKKLEAFINTLPASRVHIIAHSMGGLIATQYIKNTNGAKVDKFIAIGTPFLGSIGVVKDLELGTFLGTGFVGQISKNYFKTLLRNQSTWYQLLPGNIFFELDPETCIEKKLIHGNEITTVPMKSFIELDTFLASRSFLNKRFIDSSMEFTNNLDVRNSLAMVDPYFIIGIDQLTIKKLVYSYRIKNNQEVFDTMKIATTKTGDGSVLENSATVGSYAESRFPGHTFKFKEAHSLLPSNLLVMEQIKDILTKPRGSAVASF